MLERFLKFYCFKEGPRLCAVPANVRSLLLHRNVSEDAEKSRENPYYSKYADKISALQQTSPEILEERFNTLKDKKKPNKKRDDVHTYAKQAEVPNAKLNEPQNLSYTQTRKLDDLLKVEKLQHLSAEDISTVWKEFHQNKQCIWATIPGETFKKIVGKLTDFPTFVYPVPRNGGYEFFLSQFLGQSCYFTPLVVYQTHKEDSPSCLSVTHYTELQNSKGIILMNGEYDRDVLRVEEAQFLANQMQLYYTSDSSSKKSRMLWTFNKDPTSFKYMDVVAELEATVSK